MKEPYCILPCRWKQVSEGQALSGTIRKWHNGNSEKHQIVARPEGEGWSIKGMNFLELEISSSEVTSHYSIMMDTCHCVFVKIYKIYNNKSEFCYNQWDSVNDSKSMMVHQF